MEEFCNLAENGAVPTGSAKGHKDGWGIGYYLKKEAQVIKSGKSILDEKEKFFDSLKKINSSPCLIAHLRKAGWKNTATTENAHPFSNGKYLFAHNGTMNDYKTVLHLPDDTKILDTEAIFHFTLSKIKPTDPLNSKTLKEILDDLSRRSQDYTALNCVFSDGEKLMAYRNYTKEPGYYTLYLAEEKNTSTNLVCSEILSLTMKNPRPLSNGESVEI